VDTDLYCNVETWPSSPPVGCYTQDSHVAICIITWYFCDEFSTDIFNSPNIGREIQCNEKNRRSNNHKAGRQVEQSNAIQYLKHTNQFCVASGNLVARKFEIKLVTIKSNDGTLLVLKSFSHQWNPDFIRTRAPPILYSCCCCCCSAGGRMRDGAMHIGIACVPAALLARRRLAYSTVDRTDETITNNESLGRRRRGGGCLAQSGLRPL